MGFEAVACEIRKLASPAGICGNDGVELKLATVLVKKGTKASELVRKAATKDKAQAKLLKRAQKLLGSLSARVERDSEKISAACLAILDALIDQRLGLVQGLLEAS